MQYWKLGRLCRFHLGQTSVGQQAEATTSSFLQIWSKTAYFCTYDTFIADDLTIDMISCQEQLSTRDGTSRHKYYV